MSVLKRIFGGGQAEQPAPPPAPRPQPKPEPAPIVINEIYPHELKERLDNGEELVVVDMRQGWEYQAGHIPGATHMFIQEIPGRMNELPKDKVVVFQCWHGNTSRDASAYFIQSGWDADRIFSLHGGIAGWAEAFGQEGMEQG